MTPTALEYIDLYLQRLGFATPPAPTLETLAELQLRHTSTFVFENLSPLAGLPVPLDLPSVQHKVLLEGRGGYCYELNNLYMTLLLHLGYQVRGITGRVVMNAPQDAWAARTHRLTLVTLNGVRYITDVGFGGMVPTAPLLLDTEQEQVTPHEPYRITREDESYTLRAKVADEWRAMYVFDLQRQGDIDYEIGNWYVSTHPQSPFLQRLMVARTGEGVRHTLNNGSYAVHRLGCPSERREISDVQALIDVLRSEFSLQVPEHPALRATLARLIAAEQ
ncbi:arylamine N-acetyltransferase [Pseudomonas kielensis]|uniref:arylamine N-acetyltransferase family protein n=1 Tax=Pseudomonas TaxID=286 RepID=UPI00141329BF|nr:MULTISPECIES: arylamine N-acetyltransferase [Pseudomonas]NBB33728.1 arylamine N-acetyltransferase [Pseudomonas sp. BC115LW]WKL51686.1 arylamine N-acetyltransferase [Pseudomonas kielensis]